jgi:hypothetical protein
MKQVFFTLIQFALFFAIFFVGSFFPPFHLEHQLGITSDGTRIFVCDGLVLMVLFCAIILAIEAIRNRVRVAGPWTVVALALATIAGFVAKLGFLTR